MANNTVIAALLTLNIANFTNQLKKATQETGTAQTKMEKMKAVGQTFTSIGTTLTTKVTAPIVSLGTKAVKTAADFETGMKTVQALSGATGKDLEKLEEAARYWGKTTVYSATESAEALQYMALAGWDTEQMTDALGAVLYLAGGSMLDLGQTSDIVTDNITAFGLEAKDAAHFADVMAQTMSSSNTTTYLMGESFKYVAPLAGALGFSLEDTSLAIGLMANQGIKGSQAGTALRGALVNLVKPTDDMQQVMTQLGIEITNSDGSMKSLREIMDNLRSSMATLTETEKEQVLQQLSMQDSSELAAQAMEGLTEEEIRQQTAVYAGMEVISDWNDEQKKAAIAADYTKEELKNLTDEEIEMAAAAKIGAQEMEGLSEAEQANAASTLFGKYALSGMLAILNTSEEEYNDLADAINNADGRAQELYETQQDSLNGSIADLNSSWEELLITIGQELLPIINEFVQWLTKLVDKFSSMDKGTLQTILKIAAFAAAIGPVLIIIGQLITAVGTIITVLTKLKPVLKAITGGFNPWVIAIELVVGALIWLWNNCDEFREAVIKIFNKVREVVETVVDAVVGFFANFGDNVVKLFTETIPNGIKAAIEWFKALPGNIWDAIVSAVEKIAQWAIDIKEKFVEGIKNAIDAVIEWFQKLPERIGFAIGFAIGKIVEWGTNVKETFGTWVKDTIDSVITFFKELPGKIATAIKNTIQRIKEWGKNVKDNFKTVITNTITSIVTWFKELPGKIFNAIKTAIQKVKEWGRIVKEAFKTTISNTISNIVTWFKQLPGKILNAIKSAITNIGQWGRDMLGKAKEVIPNVGTWIVDEFKKIPGKMISIGGDIIKGIWNGIKNLAGWIGDKVSGFCKGVVKGFKSALKIGSPSRVMADEVGEDIDTGIVKGIEDNRELIDNAIDDISSDMQMALSMDDLNATTNSTGVVDILVSAVDSFAEQMTESIKRMSSVLTSFSGATIQTNNSAETPQLIADTTGTTFNIREINIRNDDDLKTISRGLFREDVNILRAQGR